MSLDLSDTATRLLGSLAISAASGNLKIVQRVRTTDKLTGTVTTDSETEVAVNGAVTDYTNNQVDGVTVQRGDRRIIIDKTVVPALTDYVKYTGKRYRIISVTEKLSGIIPQVIEIQARGIVDTGDTVEMINDQLNILVNEELPESIPADDYDD